MSGTEQVRPQSRELEILRTLFERNLKDRAVALAESRWPGSGQMIDLAYEWPSLTPSERRSRLSAIGPERIAQLRSLAALHPDLDATVAELERRGVLTHLEAAAQAGIESTAGGPPAEQATGPVPREEEPAAGSSEARAVDDGVDDGNEEPGRADAGEDEPEQVSPPFTPEGISEDDLNRYELNTEMPHLDLGLPSTAEFLDAETERRARATKDAELALDRVRQRLVRSADRALGRSGDARRTGVPAMPPVDLPEMPATGEALPELEGDPSTHGSTMVEAPEWLVEAFADDVVVTITEPDRVPSDDELVALSNALGVGLKEFRIEPGSLRKVYGGLVNRGGVIDVEAGPLPAALAGRNLAVVYGRIYPTFARRLNQGYADIPGTRATVQLHEKARILVIP